MTVEKSGCAYDAGWCRAPASGLHVATVREVFFEVAALIIVLAAMAGEVRTVSLVTMPPYVLCILGSRAPESRLTCNASVAQHGYLAVAN
jgi:hypothetical protein